jgi:hypothetical protein
MNGLQLQTEDDWAYTVGATNVVALIEAKVVQRLDLRKRDIDDRAKADMFAKLFAILQSLWVTCNILARTAYHLPISPIEISTIAYVVCATMSYALWWHKPKDIRTPITIHLPYNRNSEEMPPQVRSILDARKHCWERVPGAAVAGADEGETSSGTEREETVNWRQLRLAPNLQRASDNTQYRLTPTKETALDVFSMSIAQIFCGIHVAA